MPGLRQRPVHSIALQGRYAIEPPIDQEEFIPSLHVTALRNAACQWWRSI